MYHFFDHSNPSDSAGQNVLFITLWGRYNALERCPGVYRFDWANGFPRGSAACWAVFADFQAIERLCRASPTSCRGASRSAEARGRAPSFRALRADNYSVSYLYLRTTRLSRVEPWAPRHHERQGRCQPSKRRARRAQRRSGERGRRRRRRRRRARQVVRTHEHRCHLANIF